MKLNATKSGLGLLIWAFFLLAIGLALVLVAELVDYSTNIQKLVHEVGFAIVVAVVVWIIFEQLSHARSDAIWRGRMEQINQNVFYGVLGRRLPSALIGTANELILTRDFIRSGLRIEYELKSDSCVDSLGNRIPFVEVTAVITYALRNVGYLPKPFPVVIFLPNPFRQALKERVSVTRVVVRQDELDITDARRAFEVDLLESQRSQVAFNCNEDIILQPDETVQLTFEYVMAKEKDDDEIFNTIFAADSITLKIRDRDPLERQVGARSLHPKPLQCLRCSPEGGQYEFQLSDYLLPYQGVVFWWKRNAE